MRSISILVLLGGLAAGTPACREMPPNRSRARVLHETGQPLAVGDGVHAIRVEAVGSDTKITIRGAEIRIRGVDRYVANLGSHRGWVRAGEVTFVYDDDGARVTTRKTWATIGLTEGARYTIGQDGVVSRSVFKE